MILDHIGLHVSDVSKSRDFFVAALAPLAIALVNEGDGWAMFGRQGKGEFWIDSFAVAHAPMHIAFSASEREAVRRFHSEAIAAGASNNGAPGLRTQYHPHYYGAFVLAPDGHNIEAVCHAPQ